MKRTVFLSFLILFCSVQPALSVSPLPRDVQGSPIQAISSIKYIANVAITSSSYVVVQVPVSISCKSIFVKTRNGNSWRMAITDSPASYVLMDTGFSLAIVKTAPGVIFYARADSTSDILEILFMD